MSTEREREGILSESSLLSSFLFQVLREVSVCSNKLLDMDGNYVFGDGDEEWEEWVDGVAPLGEQSKAANWFGQTSIYSDENCNGS